MKKTLSKIRAVALIAAGAALIGSGCGNKQGRANGSANADAGVLRVGFISPNGAPPAGPEGWLYRKEKIIPELSAAGIKSVKFTAFPNGPDLNEAMAGKAIDIGMVGDTPGIVAHAAGLTTRVINQGSIKTNAWLIARADGPNSIEELKGKTVATAKGSYMARYLLGLLAEKGLSKDVKFVHLLPPDSEAALRRGDIAAYASPLGPILKSHGFKVIDEARFHPGLTGSGVTVVTQEYLTAHPGFPAVWNKMRADGIAEIKSHEDEYYRTEAKDLRIPTSVYKEIYSVEHYNPAPLTAEGLALLNGTKDFLVQQHLAKQDFKVADWMVPDQAPGAKTAALPAAK